MSGIIRNLLTLIQALFAAKADPHSRVTSHFRVTPMDCGTRVLKSDKYFQLAEAAQLDFLLKTRLFGKLLRGGVHFVNASQLVKFARPIGVFQRVRVETAIIYADDKCAYFSHAMFVGSRQHGEVLVKMKFKKGPVTCPPREFIDTHFATKPPYVQTWDEALEAM
ncbi:thioesterase family protein [Caenimonas soli]|uniref:thioesterase family protein n=1 Tax=Caenimonas soli TaxID=2735555 RepID=UPI0015570BE7|nr:thioesterase family protein [Caenimonas soli]NPC54440.1 hypothetical protein [Caenimonas soli]